MNMSIRGVKFLLRKKGRLFPAECPRLQSQQSASSAPRLRARHRWFQMVPVTEVTAGMARSTYLRVCFVLVLVHYPVSALLAAPEMTLEVDATEVGRKILHARLVIP